MNCINIPADICAGKENGGVLRINTPICDFVEKYNKSGMTRAHMPGHKGICPFPSGFDSAYPYDITEIKNADALFEAEGIIAESEKNASELFGTAETVYSCGGSTASVQTMLAICCGIGGKVIAARNVHRSFINSAALLDLSAEWIYPENSAGIVSGKITPEAVNKAIEAHKGAAAVYITSPDYLGHISDIKGIAEVCHRHGAYLICDNAHGAYTAFLEQPLHPIALGADICCDSAHKTLPVLTGGGYLHIGNAALAGKAKEYMSVFCSTSPSYLILQSLDLCNRYISERIRSDLENTVTKIQRLKDALSPPFEFYGEEPLKITVHTSVSGIGGYDAAEHFRRYGIEPEYADSCYVVLMLSPFNSDGDFERIYKAFSEMKMPRIILPEAPSAALRLDTAVSIREAVFSPCEPINTREAAGRICGRAVTVCPPGIAAAVPGEIISEEAAELLENMGINRINVISKEV